MASDLVKNVTSATFDAEVVKSAQPVVVDFWAEWCGPCKMLAPQLDEIAKEHNGKIKIVKINVDHEPALAQKYGVRAIPTLLFFKGSEQPKDQVVGMASKKDIVKKAEALV